MMLMRLPLVLLCQPLRVLLLSLLLNYLLLHLEFSVYYAENCSHKYCDEERKDNSVKWLV